jgi:23S rRNA (guanosine2251-2'-O)-methyltransferase
MIENNIESMIFGIHPVLEALEEGKSVDKVFLKKGMEGDSGRHLMEKLRFYKVPFQFVPVEKLNRLTRKNHQGVVAMISPVEFASLESLIQSLYEEGKVPLLVALDGVTDVRNFGAIARSADCLGANGIIIPFKGSAAVSADAVKTSAGALMRLPVCKVITLKETLQYLVDSGLRIVGFSEKAKQDLHLSDLKGPMVILMGSEEDGISPELRPLISEMVRIPMAGKTSSLNVSVSAGIALYEVWRQRNEG